MGQGADLKTEVSSRTGDLKIRPFGNQVLENLADQSFLKIPTRDKDTLLKVETETSSGLNVAETPPEGRQNSPDVLHHDRNIVAVRTKRSSTG